MSLTLEFPIVSSNLGVGNGVYGTADPYNTALQNNGALNPIGGVWYLQPPAGALLTAKGAGSGLWVKYVRYNSTANPAVVAGPAPVYWIDETYTTVSGVFSEGLVSATGSANSIAGWLLPNTTTLSGSGQFTNTILNGSFVFIGLSGFIPGAISVASTVAGDALIGASGNFTVARVAAGTAPTNMVAGWAKTAITSGLSDIFAACPIF